MDAHAKRPEDGAPRSPIGRAEVIDLESYRQRMMTGGAKDDLVNSEWNRLTRLAEEAWSWRDPESLAALGACVARLGLKSLEDWGV